MAATDRPIRAELESRGFVIGANELATIERLDAALGWVHAGADLIRRGFRRLAARLQQAETRHELAAMSDRELADIGLSRSDLSRKDLAMLARERAALRSPEPNAAGSANQNRAGRAAA